MGSAPTALGAQKKPPLRKGRWLGAAETEGSETSANKVSPPQDTNTPLAASHPFSPNAQRIVA